MKRWICLLLTLVILSCIVGCDVMYGKYPIDKGRLWYCAELDMYLDYRETTMAEKTKVSYFLHELTWKGERIKINVYFDTCTITMDPSVRSTVVEWEKCIDGNWEYDNEDIVFEVTHDGVFNGELLGKVFTFKLVE